VNDIACLGALKMRVENVFRDYYYIYTKRGDFYTYSYRREAFICVTTQSSVCPSVDVFEGSADRASLIFKENEVAWSNDNGAYFVIYDDVALPVGCVMKHRVFFAVNNGGLVYSAPETIFPL
jgi:hypothetical protein